MITFYDILLTLLRPFIVVFGKIGLPKRKVTGADYFKFRDSINVGTVLLTKTNFEFSNLINPTELKHAGIYVGNVFGDEVKYVFESVGEGAILTDLVTFMTTKDIVVGCELRSRNPAQTSQGLPKTVLRFKGIKYDYLFKDGGKAFYCFELAAECLKDIYPGINFKCREIVKGKKIYDHNTFLDDDIFKVVFDTRKGK
jgi:hypothetical protein